MSLDALPFNAFDLVLVIVLLAGISHGRRTGMSVELPSLLQWLLVLFLCAMAYEPAGQYLNQSTGIFSTLSCYLMAYVGIALVVVLLFAAIKKSMGGKLLGSDVFGRAEYYLGMGSGVLRFSCILLAGLAILNARAYTSTEVKAMEKFQDDVYGSNFFPTWH